MSAFMIDRKDYLAFAVQLHRFCNAPMPPHYTIELLRSLWWNSPVGVTSTWTWRIDRLVRLMMLANRRLSGIAISWGVSRSVRNRANEVLPNWDRLNLPTVTTRHRSPMPNW